MNFVASQIYKYWNSSNVCVGVWNILAADQNYGLRFIYTGCLKPVIFVKTKLNLKKKKKENNILTFFEIPLYNNLILRKFYISRNVIWKAAETFSCNSFQCDLENVVGMYTILLRCLKHLKWCLSRAWFYWKLLLDNMWLIDRNWMMSYVDNFNYGTFTVSHGIVIVYEYCFSILPRYLWHAFHFILSFSNPEFLVNVNLNID